MLQVVGHTAQDLVEVGSEPGVHDVVDDGVDAGVGHGQPVEEEEDVPDVGLPSYGGVVVGVDEVDVVGGPAYHEDQDNTSEHFYNLEHE